MRLGDLISDSESLVLISKILNVDRSWILSHLDAELDSEELEKVSKALERLRDGVPIHYITGRKEFMGLEFEVREGVFIPRYETETMVEIALDTIEKFDLELIADVGTGTGAIGISIAKHSGRRVLATDISERAVKLAIENARSIGVENLFKVRTGEYLEPFLDSYDEIDLIVSNPPYVERGASLPKEVSMEPEEAILAGEDGLDFYREFFRRYDTCEKYVLMEFSGKHKDKLVEILGREPVFLKDLDGTERFFLLTPCRRG